MSSALDTDKQRARCAQNCSARSFEPYKSMTKIISQPSPLCVRSHRNRHPVFNFPLDRSAGVLESGQRLPLILMPMSYTASNKNWAFLWGASDFLPHHFRWPWAAAGFALRVFGHFVPYMMK